MMNEQMAMIDAGIITPWGSDKTDTSKAAIALTRYYDGLGIEKTREEVLAEVQRNAVLHSGGPSGHRIFYKGNWYGRKSFAVLPETERVHDLLCVGAAEAILPVINWFLSNGYLESAEATKFVEAFFLLPPP